MQVGTKEHGKLITRIQILEDGRVLAKEARNGKIEGQKRRLFRKEYRRLSNEFELEGLTAQKKGYGTLREERGALPKGRSDVIREHKAMHEAITQKQTHPDNQTRLKACLKSPQTQTHGAWK